MATLVDARWGVDYGLPALVSDAAGEDVVVDVFESVDLSAHWFRLDEFEGLAYQRVTTTVSDIPELNVGARPAS